MSGEWGFDEVDGGTEVRWTYVFHLTSILAWLPSVVIIRFFWRAYMFTVIENMGGTSEAGHAQQGQ